MKKLITYFAILCFSLNSFAATGNGMVLDGLLSDYQYTMTVEWDQKDRSFLEEQNSFLQEKLQLLIAEGTISREALLSFAESKLSKKQMEDFKLRLTLSQPKNGREFSKLLLEIAESSAPQGARWNGSIPPSVIGVTVMFGIFALLVVLIKEKQCVEYSEQTYLECNNSQTDVWGVTHETNCRYKRKCTKWEEMK